MLLGPVDWFFVGAYFAVTIAIGLIYRRRAGSSVEEFFVSGRSVPWWLAGTSMVATTFAADTPLAVTGMVAAGGIAGNWLWWNFAFSNLLTVFFFSKLWRRANVLTDVEFAEIRYSGRPAAFLRGFRALYLALPINCIVLGWVNLAMVKVLGLTLGLERVDAIFVVLAITALTCGTSALSGLRGVLVADLFQFVLMMSMAVVLAVFAVDAAGGIGRLTSTLSQAEGAPLAFFPPADSPWMPPLALFVYLAVVWWSTWYPGAEPGGGGFVAQRMFSTVDERHSMLATLWFTVAHYAVRPWPWILTALAAMVLYPGLDDPEIGYVRMMIDHLPPSLRGLMLAGFVAAYMSTVSTNLNWGSSYLVSDVYRRFLRPKASQTDLVRAGRWSTALLAVLAAITTFYMDSIAGAWKLLLATGAGTGGVLILRWYWWRINAWSEVAAMSAAALISLWLQLGLGYDTGDPNDFAWLMLISVAGTTLIWVAVTYLTPPEPSETLEAFYQRASPGRLGWKPLAGDASPSGQGLVMGFAASCVALYSSLFAIGKLTLGDTAGGLGLLALAVASAVFVGRRGGPLRAND